MRNQIEQEFADSVEWRINDPEPLSIEEMVRLAVSGFKTCKHRCWSRTVSGSYACRCIRETFPGPEDYRTYLVARNYYIEKSITRSIMTTIEEGEIKCI